MLSKTKKHPHMKAIVFDKIGLPNEVLRLEEVPAPALKEGEVLVRMTGSSINPGDFLFIQGLYPEPKKPEFPQQIAGNHGAGIVEKTAKNVLISTGTHVAFSHFNTWAEYAVVPEEWLIPLPDTYPVEKASQFFNMITAWDLLLLSGASSGQWLVLTAGNSNVSVMVSQFAKRKGIRVISIVRKIHEDIDLKNMGAEAVIELSGLEENIRDKIGQITDNQGINGIIDNVGGPLTAELIKCSAYGSTMVINGGLCAESYRVHNNDIYLRGMAIKSHIYRYFFHPPKKEDQKFLNEIIGISSDKDFTVPIAGTHPLDDHAYAISESLQGRGKHLFKMN